MNEYIIVMSEGGYEWYANDGEQVYKTEKEAADVATAVYDDWPFVGVLKVIRQPE